MSKTEPDLIRLIQVFNKNVRILRRKIGESIQKQMRRSYVSSIAVRRFQSWSSSQRLAPKILLSFLGIFSRALPSALSPKRQRQ